MCLNLRNLRIRLQDRLPREVAKKLESLSESGMGYWRVTVTLRDGTKHKHVILIPDLFGYDFGKPKPPFNRRDIVDVEYEGYGLKPQPDDRVT